MDAVELYRVICSGAERTEVNVLWARVFQGGNLDFPEQVDSVCGHGGADGGEVLGGEPREFFVAKMLLHSVRFCN
jgi:hypothetical protein